MSGDFGLPVRALRAAQSGLALAALLVCTTAPAGAQEAGLVQVHGFGATAYGKTNHGNQYAVGSPEGDYDHSEVSLVVIAQPEERLMIATNSSLEQSPEGVEANIEYAFAEWHFLDALKLRAGRVKQPFGLYTEIFHVGTLRPFVTLPESIYGPAGIVSEGFDGLSLTGRVGGRWAVAYDVYGGSIHFGAEHARGLAREDGSIAPEAERIRDTVGGRLNVETPVSGLLVGASAYTGVEDAGRHSAVGVHGEYVAGPWSLRSELAFLREDAGVSANAFYVEAARRFGRWQTAVRYDASDTIDRNSATIPASGGRHRDAGAGLNYWFGSGFVLKISYHRVSGNRFAHPEQGEATIARSEPVERRTDMVAVGAQFSF